MALDLIVTDAGRAALVNARNTGTRAVTIAQAGLTSTGFSPTPGQTSLPGEFARVDTLGGAAVADDTIHLSLRDTSTRSYSLRGFALYLDDGTLFALYGQSAAILAKTASSDALIAVDAIFADISATEIRFGDTAFTDPAATTSTPGIVQLATAADVAEGQDPALAVTPAALGAALLALLAQLDGPGSGLDADRLDGQQGAWYADIAARLGFTPVNKAGDTIAGPLVLPGDPTAAGHAARKAYVDSLTAAAAMLARLLTVDGSGCGFDADMVDGRHASDLIPVSAFSCGTSGSGRWRKLPDGGGGTVTIQRGRTAAFSGQGVQTIVFPVQFASTDYDLQLTPVIAGADAGADNFAQEIDGTRTRSQVQIYIQDPSGGDSSLAGINWRAEGY